ncbi:MAG TPA: helix-turn-helix domain-containing protein [Dongiaceae bacterium]|nr:helix-turn-helix domain-containing protein [Dongiaceae bacterium]
MPDYIAEVAARLFYRDGIHAVGVDLVAATAGLTKRTLYRHFRSKDELIAASLRRAPRVQFPEHGAPVERILGAFDQLEMFLDGSEYRGCPYIIFTAELTEPGHPARRLIEHLLAKRRAWFRERAVEAGLQNPDDVAEQLDVLFDGAAASGAKRGNLIAARTAKRIALMVVSGATPAVPAAASDTRSGVRITRRSRAREFPR